VKPLLYADRQVLTILAVKPFEQKPNGRWYFAEDRSIADSVARRLIAHGRAKRKQGRLYLKTPPAPRVRRQLSDCQRVEGER
jgi:hypothetical protein